MTYYVSSGTLNPTHSFLRWRSAIGRWRKSVDATYACMHTKFVKAIIQVAYALNSEASHFSNSSYVQFWYWPRLCSCWHGCISSGCCVIYLIRCWKTDTHGAVIAWWRDDITSGGSRISVRGMRRGSGPQFFSEGMTLTSCLWQIVSAHRRSQDFQRVRAPRGGSRISGWGRWRDRRPLTRRGRREAPERRGDEVWGGAP